MERNKVHPMTEDRHPQPLYQVRVPERTEGVGRALNKTYSEVARSLPNDMARLLDALR
jgi:hypothetical protein